MGRFHEPQCHAIRFADCRLFRSIDLAAFVRGRQRPDAVRRVFRVARIAVHLALAEQVETRRPRVFDNIGFGDVACLDGLLQGGAWRRAMLLDAEDAARFECREKARRFASIWPSLIQL